MKSLAELADLDRASRAGDFSSLVKHLARAGGSYSEAAAMARAAHAPTRACAVLEKAAVVGGGGPDSWGAELVGYPTLISAFVDALRHTSVFYRLLGDGALVRLPFAVRVGAIATAAGAGVVEPGEAIAVSRLDLASGLLERKKAGALLVLSKELLDAGGTAAEGLISRSLRSSVATAVDATFMEIVLADVTPDNATASALADLSTALTAAALTAAARPYWISSPDVAIRLATLTQPAPNAQSRLFPEVNPIGQSTLLGIPFIVTGAVDAGELVLLDASGIGGASDTVTVDISEQAAIALDTAPTMTIGASGGGSPAVPVAANAVSLWQTNSVGIRATAFFGAAKLRATGIAALSGINW